jgi:aminopeptidase N
MKRALLLCLAALPLVAQDPFNEKPAYGRTRDFDLQHLKLELSFDLPARKVLGTATLRMAPLAGDLREAALDSAGLAIESVTVAGRPLAFRTTDDKLYLTLDRQYPGGAPVDVVIRYHAQPKRGMFFVFPDKYHPDRPKQIWANGDTAGGNNRYWFPTYDFPNDRTTTEMLITVPAGWEAISNGKLVSTREDKAAGTATFHWLQDKPMSTYLVSLVAGEFEKSEESWKVPVTYYVPRGRSGNVARTFGRTVQMLDFFSASIAPYPWAKYAQALVDTFGGGMENTSATTETTGALLDARDFEDRRNGTDSLIAHEMAHQWFGDLITCADWRHTWLNEGFATYFAALWEESAHGRDVYEWKEMLAARGIVSGGRIPVVPRDGDDSNTAYSTIYNKGGWTLHMVRGQLGDALFWKAIQHYTKKFSYRVVTTSDFVEAIAEATGQDLEWLFDQYVYKGGNPEFETFWDYDDAKHLLHLSVRQTGKADGKPDLFRVPVEIEALGDGGPRTFQLRLSKESEDFYFGLPDRPRTVLFDPRDIVLKTVTFKKPASEWIWQLEHAARALNRAEAAFALGSLSGPNVTAALERAATADGFYGVRIEAAGALGRIGSEEARPALLKMLGDRNAEVRGAAANALGGLPKNADTISRLFDVARTDASFAVRRSALSAAVRLKPDKAIESVKPFLDMDSPNQTMRATAIFGIEQIGDESMVPALLEFGKSGNDGVRWAALRAFGALGKGRQDVSDRLLEALDSPEKGDRQAAVSSLQRRRETAALPALERLAATEALPGIRRSARAAADSLRAAEAPARPAVSGAPSAGDLTSLRNRVSELEKENKELKARIDRLEKQ